MLWHNTVMPVSKTKLATSELLDHERLNALVNSMADGVIAIDEAGMIVLSNGAALNILDTNGTLRGKKLESVLHLVDKNGQKISLTEQIQSTRTSLSSRDWLIRYDDESTANLYVSAAVVHLGYGKSGQRGYVILLRDITREKSLEEERDEFISVVSHELRTPIAIAEGNVSNAILLAQKAGIAGSITDTLQATYDQIVFLSHMINDLSTLSRAEQGTLALEIEPINAHDLVMDLVRDYTPQAEEKGLHLTHKVDPRLHILRSGRLYVREILQNFITNAIKYTEKGRVTITAAPYKEGVQFSIHDTGIGISKSDQERVFDKFFRSEDWRTRQNSGTGLGLYVTMKLTRLIHAEISLKSAINKGSTFTIKMPNLDT